MVQPLLSTHHSTLRGCFRAYMAYREWATWHSSELSRTTITDSGPFRVDDPPEDVITLYLQHLKDTNRKRGAVTHAFNALKFAHRHLSLLPRCQFLVAKKSSRIPRSISAKQAEALEPYVVAHLERISDHMVPAVRLFVLQVLAILHGVIRLGHATRSRLASGLKETGLIFQAFKGKAKVRWSPTETRTFCAAGIAPGFATDRGHAENPQPVLEVATLVF